MLLYGPRFFGTEPEVFIQPVVFPKCPRILYLLSWKSTLKILLPSQTRKKLFFYSETGDVAFIWQSAFYLLPLRVLFGAWFYKSDWWWFYKGRGFWIFTPVGFNQTEVFTKLPGPFYSPRGFNLAGKSISNGHCNFFW